MKKKRTTKKIRECEDDICDGQQPPGRQSWMFELDEEGGERKKCN